jgi:ABC-2 type transport system ATP-binding protein
MKAAAIKIDHLGFSYSKQGGRLFSDFNLLVNAGERFGLFGPNGAGKTTLMGLMTGLLPFSEGNIEVAGHSIKNKKVRQLFGFVPQDFSFYEELTPSENLEFFGAWYGMNQQQVHARSEELFGILQLDAVKNIQVKKFSGGMKRKVNLAIGVLHQPEILFLDEPTVGVDVQTRYEIINYLKSLNTRGTTLIYTSHQLSEAEALCTKIALIHHGKIIAFDALDKLLDIHSQEGLEGLFIHLTGKAFDEA